MELQVRDKDKDAGDIDDNLELKFIRLQKQLQKRLSELKERNER